MNWNQRHWTRERTLLATSYILTIDKKDKFCKTLIDLRVPQREHLLSGFRGDDDRPPELLTWNSRGNHTTKLPTVLRIDKMDSPDFPSGNSPRSLQGSRPAPLRVHKDSHKIRKPPVVPQSYQQQQQHQSNQQQHRPPVVRFLPQAEDYPPNWILQTYAGFFFIDFKEGLHRVKNSKQQFCEESLGAQILITHTSLISQMVYFKWN
ncbi:hypothetical protein L1887_38647 [Cichorium endivia]|nr:hypothetical protein L1887_38647 [Cichorium endivia]